MLWPVPSAQRQTVAMGQARRGQRTGRGDRHSSNLQWPSLQPFSASGAMCYRAHHCSPNFPWPKRHRRTGRQSPALPTVVSAHTPSIQLCWETALPEQLHHPRDWQHWGRAACVPSGLLPSLWVQGFCMQMVLQCVNLFGPSRKNSHLYAHGVCRATALECLQHAAVAGESPGTGRGQAPHNGFESPEPVFFVYLVLPGSQGPGLPSSAVTQPGWGPVTHTTAEIQSRGTSLPSSCVQRRSLLGWGSAHTSLSLLLPTSL